MHPSSVHTAQLAARCPGIVPTAAAAAARCWYRPKTSVPGLYRMGEWASAAADGLSITAHEHHADRGGSSSLTQPTMAVLLLRRLVRNQRQVNGDQLLHTTCSAAATSAAASHLLSLCTDCCQRPCLPTS